MDVFEKLMEELNHPLVRDLAWVIGSPPILESYKGIKVLNSMVFEQYLLDAANGLRVLDQHPQPLVDFIGRQPRKLGKYHELLIQFWLENARKLELIGCELQVHDDAKTIGEFDFIVKQNQEYEHWEAAVKFYMAFNDTDKMANWIGPNGRDNLDLKLSLLIQKQLQLSDSKAGNDFLKQHYGIESKLIKPMLFLKGWFFYPLGDETEIPGWINQNHLKGSWTYADNLPMLDQYNKFWIFLPKGRWLAPVKLHPGKEKVMSAGEVQKYIKRYPIKRTPMLVQLTKRNGIYFEEARFFIAPNSWPQAN